MADYYEAIGRWHVALIHFPIGLLLTAALVELVGALRKFHSPTVTAVIMTGCGALGAIVASICGWVRAGDVNNPGFENVVEWHRWAGIVGSALAVVAFGLGWAALRGKISLRWPFRATLFITAIIIALAGHWGGALIHEGNYMLPPGSDAAANFDELLED